MENPQDIFGQPCQDKDGKVYRLKLLFPDKQEFVCQIEGIVDRDEADKLKGLELLIEKATLPEIMQEDTYYHSDLEGLEAKSENGEALGKVIAVHNFGAGDLLEIAGCKDFIPFQAPFIKQVDIKDGSITIELPTYV